MMTSIAISCLVSDYEIVNRGCEPQSSCSEYVKQPWVDIYSLESIVRRIGVGRIRWHQILCHMGLEDKISDDFLDERHDYTQELTVLCWHGFFNIYELPRLEKRAMLSIDGVTGYCFVRGPRPHALTDYSPDTINTLEDAQALLTRANANERALSCVVYDCELFSKMFRDEAQITPRFSELLVQGEILAYEIPVSIFRIVHGPGHRPLIPYTGTPSPAVERDENGFELVPATGPMYQPTQDLPPPAAVPPAPTVSAPQPPQSIAECEQRLAVAREQLLSKGYQSKFTDAQVRAAAKKGELDDRFVVRFIETKYAGDDGYLGQNVDGVVKYWSTTFNQLEHADTDPETICGIIGIPYDAASSYTLVVIDTQAPGAGQCTSIVPTHEKLGEFAKQEIKDIKPDIVDQVMTPEYNQVYAEHMKVFQDRGLDIKKEKDIVRYANKNFNTKQERAKFKTRAKIHERLGANEYYTGDGTTKNLIKNCGRQCGVMETFSYDKNPQTLKQLETNGIAKRLKTKPLLKRA